MQIERLDHFVLTVRDVDTTISFYQTVLGMAPVTFGCGSFPTARFYRPDMHLAGFSGLARWACQRAMRDSAA